jgi:hypothetical protein
VIPSWINVRGWKVVLLPKIIKKSLIDRFMCSPILKVGSNMLFNNWWVSNKLLRKFYIVKVNRLVVMIENAVDSLSRMCCKVNTSFVSSFIDLLSK